MIEDWRYPCCDLLWNEHVLIFDFDSEEER